MVDREKRDLLASKLRAYMSEEILSGELDIYNMEIMSSKDKTLSMVCSAIWGFYDDFKDHKVVATKEQWQYLNRLLLILESDAEIEPKEKKLRITWRQVLSWGCLICFASMVPVYGVSYLFWNTVVLLGIVAVILIRFKGERCTVTDPFPTVSSLASVRRRLFGFRKLPYRPNVAKNRVQGGLAGTWRDFWGLVATMVTWPITLVVCSIPEREMTWQVKVGGEVVL